MTSMSDSSRVKTETLSDKLYSTRRVTDLKNTVNHERYSFFLSDALILKFSLKMIVSMFSVRISIIQYKTMSK